MCYVGFLSNLLDLAVSDYALEEEFSEYVNSVHIEDNPVDNFSIPEQPEQEALEDEVPVEEAPTEEETLVSHHSVVNTVQEPPSIPLEEPVGEPPRRTYASIVSALILLFMQAFCLHMSACLRPFFIEDFSLIAY